MPKDAGMFYIRGLLISPEQEDHIQRKHHIAVEEVEEACFGSPWPLRGRDNSYAVYGLTETGPSPGSRPRARHRSDHAREDVDPRTSPEHSATLMAACRVGARVRVAVRVPGCRLLPLHDGEGDRFVEAAGAVAEQVERDVGVA